MGLTSAAWLRSSITAMPARLLYFASTSTD
jgi:hypothetical protein